MSSMEAVMHGPLIPRVTDTSTLIVFIDSNLVPNNVYTATLITVNVQGSVNSTGLIRFSNIPVVNDPPHWNAILCNLIPITSFHVQCMPLLNIQIVVCCT